MTRWRRCGMAVAATLVLSAGPVAQALSESLARIVDGAKVTMEFTVTLPDKTLVATTEGQEPLSFVQGQGQIVPGLEKALAGLKAGDKKRVEVTPDQAYGSYDEKKRFTVSKSRIPGDAKVGSLLQDKNGQPVRVVEVSGDSVVLDRNHPLAGKTVTFDVRILKVEAAEAP